MNVLLPDSAERLWRLLDEDPAAAVYAGGTDLLVKLRAGLLKPHVLVCIERIKELAGVREEAGEIVVGARTTHTTLLKSPLIARYCAILSRALSVLGSPPVRNMATIGGNICTASPAGDTLPPLYLLGAIVEIWSKQGIRSVPIEQFILGPGRTALQDGEIVGCVRIKKGDDFSIHHFEKVGQRKAMSISIASLAAMVKIDGTGAVEKIGLAWGSVGPTVVRSAEVEAALTGAHLSLAALESVRPYIEQAISPIDDLRATAGYRKAVAANLVLRLSLYGDA